MNLKNEFLTRLTLLSNTLVKEELDIEPAKARVVEYLQEKAVFVEDGKRSIKSATLPKHPLGKCIASASLLAFVITSKL